MPTKSSKKSASKATSKKPAAKASLKSLTLPSSKVKIQFSPNFDKKKLADLTAQLAPTQTYPPNRRPSPSNHLAFLIDGELTFVVPVWKQNTEGVDYLVQSTHLTKGYDPEGLSEEYVTRIAKGIVGP